jgi:hypothetical protein
MGAALFEPSSTPTYTGRPENSLLQHTLQSVTFSALAAGRHDTASTFDVLCRVGCLVCLSRLFQPVARRHAFKTASTPSSRAALHLTAATSW